MRKYKGNPDDIIIYMAVGIAWSQTKDVLKGYVSPYTIEKVISIYDKQLHAVSGIIPNGLLKKKKSRFKEILETNQEFQELKVALSQNMKNERRRTLKQLTIPHKPETQLRCGE